MRGEDVQRLLQEQLSARRGAHLLRSRRVIRTLDATHVECDGTRLVNFASNDYLGLAHHPRVVATVTSAVSEGGFGAGAAPLISGYAPSHERAEHALAQLKGADRAVLLPSGYQANLAAVQAIAGVAEAGGKGVRFLVDKLAHASLIDAARATGQPMRVFPHNGLDKLRRLLVDAEADQIQIVLTESIFSMEGDRADLHGLAELKRSHPFVLLLDEAHGTGVYGPCGAGLAAELGLQDVVDLSVVTLSKAMGCIGGGVCASTAWCDAVVNFGRAYLFSTSLPAAVAAGVEAAVGVMRDEPDRQRRVRELARRVRERLRLDGFDIPIGDSPIVAILLGSEENALAAAERLRGLGLMVVAVRPPTVPRGASRLRVTLSCEHTDDEVTELLDAMRNLQPRSR